VDYAIKFSSSIRQPLQAYADSDFAADEDRKSQSGYIFMLAGGPVAWSSKKQTCVATSTTEAEIVAANACVSDAIWFRSFLTELGIPPSAS